MGIADSINTIETHTVVDLLSSLSIYGVGSTCGIDQKEGYMNRNSRGLLVLNFHRKKQLADTPLIVVLEWIVFKKDALDSMVVL